MADLDFADKHFPRWIASMAEDVRALAAAVGRPELPKRLRAPLVGALNYLFRSLDIIPDWFPGLGFVDDAIILRVGAALAAAVDAGGAAGLDAVYKLGNEAELVKELLGEELDAKMLKYVESLPAQEVRGRSADTVLKDDQQLKDFLEEVAAFADDYKPATYEANDKYPEKLRLFVSGKLR